MKDLFDQTNVVGAEVPMRFDGPDYSPQHDQVRLASQTERVFQLMKDGRWRTLDEIASATGDPPASVSARLRDLRKKRFGAHTVLKQSRGERVHGLFEYRLFVQEDQP